MTLLKNIDAELAAVSSPDHAAVSRRFFKTGPGEYGEGDIFIGVRVPALRAISRKYKDLERSLLTQLLQSEVHEKRLLALFILVLQYKKGNLDQQKDCYDLYLKNVPYINNWDLIDSSAHTIVGAYLEDKSKELLYNWAKSEDLWERRIAMMSTFYYIRKNNFDDALAIAEILVHDSHDLIQKAVGWMLREIGKRELEAEESFLKKYYKTMPRTMLRYAIEKFEENKRKAYLKGGI